MYRLRCPTAASLSFNRRGPRKEHCYNIAATMLLGCKLTPPFATVTSQSTGSCPPSLPSVPRTLPRDRRRAHCHCHCPCAAAEADFLTLSSTVRFFSLPRFLRSPHTLSCVSDLFFYLSLSPPLSSLSRYSRICAAAAVLRKQRSRLFRRSACLQGRRCLAKGRRGGAIL